MKLGDFGLGGAVRRPPHNAEVGSRFHNAEIGRPPHNAEIGSRFHNAEIGRPPHNAEIGSRFHNAVWSGTVEGAGADWLLVNRIAFFPGWVGRGGEWGVLPSGGVVYWRLVKAASELVNRIEFFRVKGRGAGWLGWQGARPTTRPVGERGGLASFEEWVAWIAPGAIVLIAERSATI